MLQRLDAILPPPDGAGVRLVVFHYHDRPGGVRRVISCGLPQLVTRLNGVTEVVLLLGELTDPGWLRDLEAALAGIVVRTVVHRGLGYLSGGPQETGGEARALVLGELSGKEVLVWAHNLSVGRNLPLLRQLPEWCAAAGAGLWLHHHDWWWDGRWARWADWQAGGIHDLEQALELSIPLGPHIRHWCVNGADLPMLQSRAGQAAQWVGNPLPEFADPGKLAMQRATDWLHEISGGRRVWLAPVRALRRKNLAEAILLAQSQAEPTCIVTTGGPGSAAEVPAWEALCQATARQQWPFVPGVLAKSGSAAHPPLAALLTAADAIVMPSLQEGFGLPYLEAAALRKPLLARHLPDVTANLAALGCTFAGAYDSLFVPADSFDFKAESVRRAARWSFLQSNLPRELRLPVEVSAPLGATDFGTLTLAAQLEVLQANPRPALRVSGPLVPDWPGACRVDQWVERLGGTPARPAPAALLAGGDAQIRPSHRFPLPEVIRRFRYWQQHPLLWP